LVVEGYVKGRVERGMFVYSASVVRRGELFSSEES
jgi:hypothetical protein